MAPRGKKRIFIDDLGKRWGRDADHVLDLAIDGQLPLWIEFTDVFLQTPEKSSTGKSVGRLYEQVAVQPLPGELVQMRGRCDRMLIAAELACLTERGKEMRLTNAAGDDWGEVSMVGIKPTRLFAWMKDVTGLEKAQNIEPVPDYAGEAAPARAAATPGALNPVDHPCHAPELHCRRGRMDQTQPLGPGPVRLRHPRGGGHGHCAAPACGTAQEPVSGGAGEGERPCTE